MFELGFDLCNLSHSESEGSSRLSQRRHSRFLPQPVMAAHSPPSLRGNCFSNFCSFHDTRSDRPQSNPQMSTFRLFYPDHLRMGDILGEAHMRLQQAEGDGFGRSVDEGALLAALAQQGCVFSSPNI